MRKAMTTSRWSSDLTMLCERLAERLRAEGATYPGAGAVALTARGVSGEDRDSFCRRLGLGGDELRHIERGEVPIREWPAPLRVRAAELDRRGDRVSFGSKLDG
jgi:hypothetical protein